MRCMPSGVPWNAVDLLTLRQRNSAENSMGCSGGCMITVCVKESSVNSIRAAVARIKGMLWSGAGLQ